MAVSLVHSPRLLVVVLVGGLTPASLRARVCPSVQLDTLSILFTPSLTMRQTKGFMKSLRNSRVNLPALMVEAAVPRDAVGDWGDFMETATAAPPALRFDDNASTPRGDATDAGFATTPRTASAPAPTSVVVDADVVAGLRTELADAQRRLAEESDAAAAAKAAATTATSTATAATATATAAEQRCSALQSQLESQRQETVAAQTALETASANAETLRSQLATAAQDAEAARSSLAEAERSCAVLREQVSSLQRRCDELQQRCDTLQPRCDALQQRCDALQQQQLADVDGRVASLQEQWTAAEQRCAAAQALVQEQGSRLEAATRRVTEAEQATAAAVAKAESATAAVASLRQQCDDANARATTSGSTAAELAVQVSELQRQCVDSEQRFEAFQRKWSQRVALQSPSTLQTSGVAAAVGITTDHRLSTTEAALTAAETRTEVLARDLADARQACTKAELEASHLRVQLASATASAGDATERAATLQDRLDKSEQRFEESHARVTKVAADAAVAEERRGEAAAAAALLTVQCERVTVERDRLQERVLALQAEVDGAVTAREGMRIELSTLRERVRASDSAAGA